MIAGIVGGFITTLLGGWDSALVTLIVFMGVDFFTGVVTATMGRSKHTDSGGLSSKAGWIGLAKKVCTLLLIAVAVRMDILLGTTYIRDAVCISFCLNELLSIVENTRVNVHDTGIVFTTLTLPTPAVRSESVAILPVKQFSFFL